MGILFYEILIEIKWNMLVRLSFRNSCVELRKDGQCYRRTNSGYINIDVACVTNMSQTGWKSERDTNFTYFNPINFIETYVFFVTIICD